MGNLNKNNIFEGIEFVKILRKKESPFLNGLQCMFEKASELLDNRVSTIFPNYTLHDINHSIRVANNMYSIIKYIIEEISELDIVILLYSAILHDIGMVVDAAELEQIKTNNYTDDRGVKLDIQLAGIKKIDWIKKIEDPNELDFIAIQEYIRRLHGFRSRMFVKKTHKENLNIFSIPSLPNANIEEEVGFVCESHNESYDWIKDKLKMEQTKGNYIYSPLFCACVLRLADIIDIDERRTPSSLLKSINPKYRSKEEWLQHRVIQNIEKVEHDNGRIKFKFQGECNNAHIHRKVYRYLDWVRLELSESNRLFKRMPNAYRLDIDSEITCEIDAKGNYTNPDNKISIDFKAISSLLMGERIYGDKKYGLRELLQNSIDACRLRKEIESNYRKEWEEPYKPRISIIINQKTNEIIIKDNGIGMTLEVLKNNFLSIGKSYYQSDNFIVQGYDYTPIGSFGIGFLACFMLSDEIQIKTRHVESPMLYTLNMEKGEEYSAIEYCDNNRFEGTEVTLNYGQFISSFEGINQIEQFIQEQIKVVDIEIYIYSSSTYKRIDTNFHVQNTNTHVIDASIYLNNIEGLIALNESKIVYEKIQDLEIEAGTFFYQDDQLIISRDVTENSILSKICKNNILEYLVAHIEDTLDNEYYSYYVFFNNNTTNLKDVENITRSHILNLGRQRGLSDPSVDIEVSQMYFFNDSGKYHYSIPYYSEHTESQNMVSIDESIYSPLGNFYHNEFHLYSIYNNGIFVRNDEYENTWITEYYTRHTILDIIEYSLNIKKGLALDVSRHNFIDKNEVEIIQNSIIKAMHIAAYHEFELTSEEKDVLKAFIKIHYPEDTIYVKELI